MSSSHTTAPNGAQPFPPAHTSAQPAAGGIDLAQLKAAMAAMRAAREGGQNGATGAPQANGSHHTPTQAPAAQPAGARGPAPGSSAGTVRPWSPEGMAAAPEPYVGVSIKDLYTRPSASTIFIIDALVPARQVTLMPADGGVGKSILWLQAAVCIALGLPFMGKVTTRCKVVLFSAEDDVEVLRNRLHRICQYMGLDNHKLAELEAWLLIIDATESPCLFTEFRAQGESHATMTRNLERIAASMVVLAAGGKERVTVIIDNASDVYDANENVRQHVRAFVRGLRNLVKRFNGACVLLAHLDKFTVRNGGSAQFSGSTAWHNSVRSRLLLVPDDQVEDQLILTQEKNNFGRKSEPIYLHWNGFGVLEYRGSGTSEPVALEVAIDKDGSRMTTVLALIQRYYDRERWIDPSFHNATKNGPYKTLHTDPDYPQGMKAKQLEKLIGIARAKGLLDVQQYRCEVARRTKERLALTTGGAANRSEA